MSGDLHPWLAFDTVRVRKVVTAFTADYVRRSGAERVVLGMSGGLDSAVVGALAADALGPAAVHALFLPGPTSPEEDRELATEVCEALGVALDEVPIDGPADALYELTGTSHDPKVRANIQARLRMTVLYARAWRERALVIGTGNKSELLTGYFTKHGDGGVDILPIGDLYKTQVRVLASDLGLSDRVIDRPATASLWEGQTDEEELGIAYERLDVVLAGIEHQRRREDIADAAKVDAAEVDRIAAMVRSTWHKRNAPPIPKLGWRTVGVDWREPTL